MVKANAWFWMRDMCHNDDAGKNIVTIMILLFLSKSKIIQTFKKQAFVEE